MTVTIWVDKMKLEVVKKVITGDCEGVDAKSLSSGIMIHVNEYIIEEILQFGVRMVQVNLSYDSYVRLTDFIDSP